MIAKDVFLACGPARAFALFTERAGEWWPEDRRHTGDPESEIRMEPEGGFWEQSRDGKRAELGRVRVWEPGARLVLDFYVGTDAEHPTAVEIRFQAEGDGTRVSVQHGPGPTSAELWNRRAPLFDRSWQAVLQGLGSFADERVTSG